MNTSVNRLEWLPLILWLTVIYTFSTDSFSAENTSGFFAAIMRFVVPGISTHALDVCHVIVRKLGHVSEYFVLAVLGFRAFSKSVPEVMRTANVTLAFVITVAAGDEFRQALTISRSGSITDVGYDSLGAVIAMCLYTPIAFRRSIR